MTFNRVGCIIQCPTYDANIVLKNQHLVYVEFERKEVGRRGSLGEMRGWQLNYRSNPNFELESRKCLRTRTCS